MVVLCLEMQEKGMFITMKPIIGITCGLKRGATPSGITPTMAMHQIGDTYVKAVERAGGIPVVLPICEDLDSIGDMVAALDGVILSGGPDIDPRILGMRAATTLSAITPARDAFDLAIGTYVLEKTDMPLLGICRGVQVLNTVAHGSLLQDMKTDGKLEHKLTMYPRSVHSHDVTMDTDSKLSKILGGEKVVGVNSLHHQAVNEPGEGMKVVARSIPDDVVEAIELPGERFVIGTQWHPEALSEDDNMQNIFRTLVKEAAAYKAKKSK